MWQNLLALIVKKLTNKNCDKTQNLELWKNSKTQIVTKPKNSKCNKTQQLKLGQNPLKAWQISKTQTLAKLKLWQNSTT